MLALSWNIQTLNGADAILKALPPLARSAVPSGFAIDPDRAAPRKVMRAGTNAIEAIFKFETNVGRGSGIIRLIPDADDGNRLKAWTLLTELGELKGFEEQLGVQRPRGNAYSRDFRGPNWLDLRNASAAYADRDPDRARDRRRPIRPFHRRAAEAVERRYADRRSREAHRRQLAQALPCADAA